MYTREQAAQIKREFWTAFGNYMSPLLSADGLKINWLNYKTGIKNVFFRLDADKTKASIAIEITHQDNGIQELFFEQFLELKGLLHAGLEEEWEWILHTTDENGKIISKIYKQIDNINVFKESDWPALISFFKPRIIALDNFWSDAKYSFDSLK
jgi:hypothetical protein